MYWQVTKWRASWKSQTRNLQIYERKENKLDAVVANTRSKYYYTIIGPVMLTPVVFDWSMV